MDFDLSEEQNILKDSISRLLSDKYSFEKRLQHQQSAKGWSEALWADYAEMGLLAMSFAEEDGGLGGNDVDRMVVSEALGKALILEPYFATIVLGGSILRHGGTAEQRSRLVPQVAGGRLKFAFAYLEPHSRYDLGCVQTRAEPNGDGWRITGKKTVVIHGGSADKIFVTARTGDVAGGETPIGLFLVDAKAPGVSIQDYLTHDGLHAADITCEGVSVAAQDVFGIPGKALPLVQRVVDDAIAALCAEALGAMTIMLDLTVDYLKVRNQFGGPIGRFQALQHRASEMYVAVEQARSMTLFATAMLASPGDERTNAVRAAKFSVGREGRFVGESAIQLHGGIGMTMESAVGHYFKRMAMIDLLFGDSDHHMAALADSGARFS